MRLANAVNSTKNAISDGDEPPFTSSLEEGINSLLLLHGTFILATVEGQQAIEAEQRYQRRPEEEKSFREDVKELASRLQKHPELIVPEVSDELLMASSDIERGPNPVRSDVAGHGVTNNILIVASGAALVGVVFSSVGHDGVDAIARSVVGYLGQLALTVS